ncbi:hypothetical protein AYO49_04925 [Verrucomicrobiaceae bacterium SCGC AG-212-N21]|nr:hypothetical protein AYO49_04925 [Verrucomicrobiaceae bacterium SCGC AG-212-N21]
MQVLHAIEYNFTSDAFTVTTLSEYVMQTQKAFQQGVLYAGTLLAVHPTEAACRDEVSVWMDRRDEYPLTRRRRAEEYMRHMRGFVPQFQQEEAADAFMAYVPKEE